jgi:MFS family permease
MALHYRTLLGIKGVRRLLVCSVLARMPLGMCSLAILLFVRGRTGSFLTAGLAVGAFTLGSAAVAPLQGTLIDRVGQIRVLVPCAAGQGMLLIALVALGHWASSALMIVLAGAAGALTPPVSTCVRVLWPEISADPAVRETAFALDAITQEIIWVLGPLLVATVVTAASSGAAVLLGAAITMLGTAGFASLSAPRRWRSDNRERRLRTSALSSRGLRMLLVSVLAMGTTIGAVEVGLPALAGHLGSRGSAGVLLALWSVGSMTGGVLYGARNWRLSIDVRHATLLAAVAVLTAPLLLAHSLALSMILSLLAGVAIAPAFSCQYTLVSSLAPKGAVAEAFTWQTAALVAGIAAGSACGGTLVDLGGAYLPFALGCAAAILGCLLAALKDRRTAPLEVIVG